MSDTKYKCQTCWDCGQVANSEDQEPWSFWSELKPPENIAVVMGLVKPVPCPKCTAVKTINAGDAVDHLIEEYHTDAMTEPRPYTRIMDGVPYYVTVSRADNQADPVCSWKEDEEALWATDCGHYWEFGDGGVKENNVSYCHNCGKSVKAMPYTEGEASNG